MMEMFGVFCVAVGNSGWHLVDSMVQAAQKAVQQGLVPRELVGADPDLRIGMLALCNQPKLTSFASTLFAVDRLILSLVAIVVCDGQDSPVRSAWMDRTVRTPSSRTPTSGWSR
nr:hypothetical protein [Azospirillum sp. INR13]